MLKTINHKAIAATAFVAVLLATSCGVGIWAAMELSSALNHSVRLAVMIRTQMDADMMHDALRADVLAAVAARDPSVGISASEAREDLSRHAAVFRKDVQLNHTRASNAVEEAVVKALDQPLADYIAAAEQTFDGITRDPASAGQAVPAFLKKFEVLEGGMAHTSDQLEAEAATAAAAAEAAEKTARLLTLIMLGIGAVASVCLAVLVRRTLVGPLRSMTAAMAKLASGDLQTHIPAAARNDEIGEMSKALVVFKDSLVERVQLQDQAAHAHQISEDKLRQTEDAFRAAGRDQSVVVQSLAGALEGLAAGDLTMRLTAEVTADYQKLKDDFNEAMARLEEAMTVIAANAQGITAGAGEISQAADDLSRRTEQQAATLEETAAALDEITSTVRRTAEGANQANAAVVTARADAEKSGEVVSQAVLAMSGIETSSREISQIIGVIDEIAFQTNLLALNAGVEAARAGDAGRGFAVVASEVRALAQRSADAAKQIKGLISASSRQVGDGVELVGQAGQALERIAGQVNQISGLVSEIAASAQEQAIGLTQVNTAVNQMDQTTQQNAAMVEQSTAASHSLAGEAGELSRLVGRFQIDGRASRLAHAAGSGLSTDSLPVRRAAA